MKKLFSLLLVLAMVFSMSLAAADSAETIKIGVIAYGSAAARASILGYFMNGWEVAAEQVNAAGGLRASRSRSRSMIRRTTHP